MKFYELVNYVVSKTCRVTITMILAPVLLFCFGLVPEATAAPSSGFVYVMTNQTKGNSVIRYSRSNRGSLTMLEEVATDGLGGSATGGIDPLVSADSLIRNGNGSLLLAVNAGSNEISSLTVGSGGMSLVMTVPSGGEFPNSIAMSGNLVYVLNHGTPNISGFHVSPTGALTPIAGSTMALPGGADSDPHDIRFSPDGSRIIVTDGGTNEILIFDVGSDGIVTAKSVQPSAGQVPFGFAFGRGQTLVATEAMSGSVSTYQLTNDSMLNPISSVVQTGQGATCWISVGNTGHAFTSNTASGTISSYQVAGGSGHLNLIHAVAAFEAGSAPIDTALTSDDRFLYVQDSANGRILGYRVNGTNLARVEVVDGLPQNMQGIVAQ